ncbi:MAG: hypothetical protein M1839_003945 [Geoglossum umbratile]|nr:MAG: hypothetical protein M1839_003945 [Geoglossum umbratile]
MASTRSSNTLDDALASLEQLKSDVNTLKSTKRLQSEPTNMLDLLVKLTEDIFKEPGLALQHSLAALKAVFESQAGKDGVAKPAIQTLNARDASEDELMELFNIKYNRPRIARDLWELEHEPHEVPVRLRNNLRDLELVFYNERSEATTRIAVDTMLLQSCLALRKLQAPTPNTSVPTSATDSPQTPSKGNINPRFSDDGNCVLLYPEIDISVKVTNHRTGKTVIVQGRADWAFGYGTKRNKDGTFIAAMEAKQRSEFSKGESQLLAYLCILRETRRRANKVNINVQGFWTDGMQYTFMCIRANGVVQQSRHYDIQSNDKDFKTVFNFVVNMFEVAMKSTPNATPTKPGVVREKEVGDFQGEGWEKIYESYKELSLDFTEYEDEEGEAMDI